MKYLKANDDLPCFDCGATSSHFCPGPEDDEHHSMLDVCLHPGHNPPSSIAIPPGAKFVHVCPACGDRATLFGRYGNVMSGKGKYNEIRG